MALSIKTEDNSLIIKELTNDTITAVWSKKLDTFEINRPENTTISIGKKGATKLLFWQPVGENILMVFSRSTTVKCLLATKNTAYLRLVERINEVVSVSLSRKGLDISWIGGIINLMDAEISDARIMIGHRMEQSFSIPVFQKRISEEEKQQRCIHHFHFSLQELIKKQNEINSRISVSITINGYTTEFPIKTHRPSEPENEYPYAPVTSFYKSGYAIQLKCPPSGNIIFLCRPMADIEHSSYFRFWNTPLVSGIMYHIGHLFKKISSRKIALFYEKFCDKAEEGTYEIFLEAQKTNPKGAYYIINKNSIDYEKIKENRNVILQFSAKYYWLIFRTSCYISTEAPTHLHMLRSNNRYFRKTIAENIFVFLQHGITYLKCQGGNSVFVKGRESSPSYIIADSDKERDVLVRMLHLPPERILKTGMAIFSKIEWKHLNQDSEDIAVIMLTWKPYEEAVSDFTQTSYYKNTLGIYQLLCRYLSPEQIRIVIHPKTKGHLENTPLASCIWTQPISQVLSIAKLLITDYSSVCYNSFYQGGGVVFFQEDLQYYEKENGKLIPAEDEYIGKRVFSLEALDDVLREGIVTDAGGRGRILLSSFRTEEFERRYHLINEYSDGKNIERICDALRTRGLI